MYSKRMKKIIVVFALSCLVACHGNEAANNKPNELDRTDNDDTNAVEARKMNTKALDSLNLADTTHKNRKQ